jgi:hypothetical protein
VKKYLLHAGMAAAMTAGSLAPQPAAEVLQSDRGTTACADRPTRELFKGVFQVIFDGEAAPTPADATERTMMIGKAALVIAATTKAGGLAGASAVGYQTYGMATAFTPSPAHIAAQETADAIVTELTEYHGLDPKDAWVGVGQQATDNPNGQQHIFDDVVDESKGMVEIRVTGPNCGEEPEDLR